MLSTMVDFPNYLVAERESISYHLRPEAMFLILEAVNNVNMFSEWRRGDR